MTLQRLTVFCGSNSGNDPSYSSHAAALGCALAEHRIGLVYGGTKIGLMGIVANAALKNGGEVIGVLPAFLKEKEIAHDQLTDLILVDTMHERKRRMSELCDGVIALPGGFGTLDELFEMLTWAQLGIHGKPVGLYNINGFYNGHCAHMDTMVRCGFLKESHRQMLLVSDDVTILLDQMVRYHAPAGDKWISPAP